MGENPTVNDINIFVSGFATAFFFFQATVLLYIANEKSSLRAKKIIKTTALLNTIIALQIVLDTVAFYIMGWHSSFCANMLNLIDTTSLPIFLALIYSSTRNHVINWDVLAFMELGCIIPIAAYAITASQMLYTIILAAYILILAIALLLSIRSIRRYNKKLKDTYSDTDKRELKWVAQFVWMFLVIAALWFIFESRQNYEPMEFIYYITIMLPACFITKNLIRQNYDISVMQDDALLDFWKDRDKEINEATDELKEKEEKEEDVLGQKIREYLIQQRHFTDPDINVATLATEVGSNRTYLAAWFKKSGMALGLNDKANFNGFINIYRMALAGHLLTNTNYSIVDIYTKVGYESQQTFYRIFKETYGVSPTEYRQDPLTRPLSPLPPGGEPEGDGGNL